MAQSLGQMPFTSEVVGSILAKGLMWRESVNAVPKVVGLLRALQPPPTGNLTGCGKRHS